MEVLYCLVGEAARIRAEIMKRQLVDVRVRVDAVERLQ